MPDRTLCQSFCPFAGVEIEPIRRQRPIDRHRILVPAPVAGLEKTPARVEIFSDHLEPGGNRLVGLVIEGHHRIGQVVEQGLQPVVEQRQEQTFKGLGAEIKDFYLVTGQYDCIIVVEAPDEETVTRAALAVGSRGAVRTETVRAFTESEYRELLGSLP